MHISTLSDFLHPFEQKQLAEQVAQDELRSAGPSFEGLTGQK